MSGDLATLFAEDGFVTVENVIDSNDCAAILQETIRAFQYSGWSFVHGANFRIHTPLPMNSLFHRVIRRVVEPVYDLMDRFLQREKYLAELSSITVFPNADGQPIHRDERAPGKYIISVFVNLVATSSGVGALEVIPASHRDELEGTAKLLELPAGSAVFMNGKLKHRGTENRSVDRIRPVFYFSFGDTDISGPVYSIRPENYRRAQLGDFAPRRLSSSSIPRFTDGHWVAIAPATRSVPRRIVAMNVDRFESAFELEDSEHWIADLAELLARGEMSVDAIAKTLALDVGEVTEVLEELRGEGLVTW